MPVPAKIRFIQKFRAHGAAFQDAVRAYSVPQGVALDFYGIAPSVRKTLHAEGRLNVASMLGIIEERPEPPTPKYIVEDDRDESGHMQLHHPSPMDGFFEPAVVLGDVVRRGDPIGHVVDELGSKRVAVPAANDGTVLHLRCYPSVLEGDALGGMLPITEPGKVVFERGDPDS